MSSFYNIAKNPIYCGYQFNTNGELIKNQQWDGIISYELFEAVQKIMQKKRMDENKHHKTAKTGRFMPLRGYIFCGICGSRLIAGISRGKVYYRCPMTYLKKDTACSRSRIAESVDLRGGTGLKEVVFKFFKIFLQQESSIFQVKNSCRNKIYAAEKIAEFNQKQNSAAEAFINGLLPLSEYSKCTKNLTAQIRTLQNQNRDFSTCNYFDSDNLYKRYLQKNISDDEFMFLLKKTLNRITVFPQKVIFDTRFGIYEYKRKIIKRQQGMTKMKF
jgi:hypothetical protein